MRNGIIIVVVSALAFFVVVASAGCATGGDVVFGEPGPAYPEQAPQAETLDIQVFIRDNHQTVALTNTTGRDFGVSRLWLNAWYSAPVDGLGVGESLSVPLTKFRDVYGGQIRTGGFFATRRAEPIVLVELESDESIFGLIRVQKEAR